MEKLPIMKEVVKEQIEFITNNGKLNNKNLEITNEMKNITGEISIRSFFGGNCRSKKIGDKTINQEITFIFQEAFNSASSVYGALKVELFGWDLATKHYWSPTERNFYKRYL